MKFFSSLFPFWTKPSNHKSASLSLLLSVNKAAELCAIWKIKQARTKNRRYVFILLLFPLCRELMNEKNISFCSCLFSRTNKESRLCHWNEVENENNRGSSLLEVSLVFHENQQKSLIFQSKSETSYKFCLVLPYLNQIFDYKPIKRQNKGWMTQNHHWMNQFATKSLIISMYLVSFTYK